MTEAEWLDASDLQRIRPFLFDRVNKRKMRLFGCACCYRVLHLCSDEAGRKAVEVAERYADGLVSQKELTAAREAALAAAKSPLLKRDEGRDAARAAAEVAQRNATAAGWRSASEAARAAGTVSAQIHDGGASWSHEHWCAAHKAEEREQVSLLLCILGNPFRPAPALSPAILAWNNGAVPKLARSIYDGRAFDRLPILADALEEAGCDDANVLAHCRSGGEHFRGCWVVDWVLGKG